MLSVTKSERLSATNMNSKINNNEFQNEPVKFYRNPPHAKIGAFHHAESIKMYCISRMIRTFTKDGLTLNTEQIIDVTLMALFHLLTKDIKQKPSIRIQVDEIENFVNNKKSRDILRMAFQTSKGHGKKKN